jgi:hypothetical protein
VKIERRNASDDRSSMELMQTELDELAGEKDKQISELEE